MTVINQNIIWEEVGIPFRGEALLVAVSTGFEYPVFNRLISRSRLTETELSAALHIAPGTLLRRSKAGQFTTDESDRLFRLVCVIEAAEELFQGQQADAKRWLTSPARGLGERLPIAMVGTSIGTQAVLDLIGQLEHGVCA